MIGDRHRDWSVCQKKVVGKSPLPTANNSQQIPRSVGWPNLVLRPNLVRIPGSLRFGQDPEVWAGSLDSGLESRFGRSGQDSGLESRFGRSGQDLGRILRFRPI
jgi:hypothetical protein